MRFFKCCSLLVLLLGVSAPFLVSAAQAQAPKPEPDVLIFTNGDKLTGTLERVVGTDVTFKSDMAGELTIDSSKIKELRSNQQFAVLEKNQHVTRKTPNAAVPQGTIVLADKTVTVTPQAEVERHVPLDQTAYVVDEGTFNREVRTSPGFLSGWNGQITAAASLVEATQNSYTANGGISLIRQIPSVPWLDPRNRTTADFSLSYGEISGVPEFPGGPRGPSTKTDIYHGDAERDQYISPRFFYLGHLTYDHNYSQGLQLAQLYGGGFGWTVLKDARQELDLKADVHYTRESFYPPTTNQDLIGSIFSDNYTRNLPRKMVFTQFLSASPAFNNPSAFAGSAGVNLTAPVFKRLAFSAGATDSFINNPGTINNGVPSKKNSVQITTGLTYTLH